MNAASSLPFFHHFPEVAKEVVGVVWAWARLRMVLHAEERHGAMAQAFQGVVVEVDVGELDFALVDRFRIYREVVIVRGDLHFAGLRLLDRMVTTVVAKFELVSLATQSQTDQLMAETDAKHRPSPDQFADVF